MDPHSIFMASPYKAVYLLEPRMNNFTQQLTLSYIFIIVISYQMSDYTLEGLCDMKVDRTITKWKARQRLAHVYHVSLSVVQVQLL